MSLEFDMSQTHPALTGEVVTALDSTDLSIPARALYIGGSGSLKVTTVGGSDLTFPNVLAGQIYPIAVTKVWSGGTTATSMIALR